MWVSPEPNICTYVNWHTRRFQEFVTLLSFHPIQWLMGFEWKQKMEHELLRGKGISYDWGSLWKLSDKSSTLTHTVLQLRSIELGESLLSEKQVEELKDRHWIFKGLQGFMSAFVHLSVCSLFFVSTINHQFQHYMIFVTDKWAIYDICKEQTFAPDNFQDSSWLQRTWERRKKLTRFFSP